MKTNYLITFLLLLIVIPLISAQPPVTTIAQFPEGYLVAEANQDYVKINTDFTHHWFLYNASNGKVIDNVSVNCSMFMADITGNVLLETRAKFDPQGFWYVDIDGNNFSSTGFYSYGINCQDGFGGAVAGAFEATNNGKESPTGIVIVVYTILFIAIFFASIYYFFKALDQVTKFEMDLYDTIILMGSYFSIWIFYYFSVEYVGNAFMNNILELAITIGAFTHVLLALVGFFVSFIMTNLKLKQKASVTY